MIKNLLYSFTSILIFVANISTIKAQPPIPQQEIAKRNIPKKVFKKINWSRILPIENDSILIGWQVNLKDTAIRADSSFQFLIMENDGGSPFSFFLNTIKFSYHPKEKLIIPRLVTSKNLLNNQISFTDLWGYLGAPDTTINGKDNICNPRCDTLSRVLLIPHPEDTALKAKRRYFPVINSYYLGIKNNPKSYSIGSLFQHINVVRPLLNTQSYIYLHPYGIPFSTITGLEELDITRFKGIYVMNFFLWWKGAEYPQKEK